MWNELRRRYVNTEMLFWLAGAVISQEVLLTIFLRSLQRNASGTPCVLDVLTCMSQNYVFPLMMIIAAVCNQRMMKCDRNPMIILKYSSRAGIYLWQSICTIVYSAVLSLIYELAAIAYAATKFDVFFNWNSYSSYKLMNMDVLPAGQVTSIQVMFVYFDDCNNMFYRNYMRDYIFVRCYIRCGCYYICRSRYIYTAYLS